MRKKWTKEEIDFIQKNYNVMTSSEIAKALNLKQKQVSDKIYSLVGKLNKRRYWTEEEKEYLIKSYPNKPRKEIVEYLNRSWSSIASYAHGELKLFRKIREPIKKRAKYDNVHCLNCKKEYDVLRTNKSNKKFCSKECHFDYVKKNDLRKGKNNSQYGKRVPKDVKDKNSRYYWNKNNNLKKLISYLKDGKSYIEIAHLLNISKRKVIHGVRYYNLGHLYHGYRKSDGQRILYKILKNLFPNNLIIEEYRVGNTRQYFDFYDIDLNIAYEFNGIQHYKQNGTWNENDEDFELQVKRDKKKEDWCKKNNIPLIIVRYDEKLDEELIINKLNDKGINYDGVNITSSSS